MEPTTPAEQLRSSKADNGIGAIVGSIVVVLIIILGAFYLFSLVQERRATTEETETTNTEQPATNEELEAELQMINTADLDAELGSIEAEFSN